MFKCIAYVEVLLFIILLLMYKSDCYFSCRRVFLSRGTFGASAVDSLASTV